MVLCESISELTVAGIGVEIYSVVTTYLIGRSILHEKRLPQKKEFLLKQPLAT